MYSESRTALVQTLLCVSTQQILAILWHTCRLLHLDWLLAEQRIQEVQVVQGHATPHTPQRPTTAGPTHSLCLVMREHYNTCQPAHLVPEQVLQEGEEGCWDGCLATGVEAVGVQVQLWVLGSCPVLQQQQCLVDFRKVLGHPAQQPYAPYQ